MNCIDEVVIVYFYAILISEDHIVFVTLLGTATLEQERVLTDKIEGSGWKVFSVRMVMAGEISFIVKKPERAVQERSNNEVDFSKRNLKGNSIETVAVKTIANHIRVAVVEILVNSEGETTGKREDVYLVLMVTDGAV